jgi:DNA-binding HxlR family transcriptional regulator
MAKAPRSYGDACRTAHALDLIGDRWALLVVRELLLGPKRFTDLAAGLPRATPDMLSQRLQDLEREGIVRRRKLAPPAAASVYELTEWGAELEPVLIYLGAWSGKSPQPPRDPASISPVSFALALRSHFDPEAAGDMRVRAVLRMDGEEFRVEVADGKLEIKPEQVEDPDIVIELDQLAVSDALWGDESLEQVRKDGGLKVEGDLRLAKRLFALFPDRIVPPALVG